MNKDEILAKSREENKSADERQKHLQQKAGTIASAVGMALCCIVAFLEGIFGDSVILFYGCFSIYWGITASNGLVLAIFEKKKLGWLGAIVNVIFFILFMTKLLFELI
ncbi:MAG: hypothetical protein J6C27_07350 [Clostridia bacterium]|nr:hypothetical protein [Clostridia bacterium]